MMLHKSKFKKSNTIKYAFVLPVITILLMSFNTTEIYLNENASSIAQTLGDMEIVIISKDFNDEALEKVKIEFKSKEVDLQFKNIKRNNFNEIIAIKIEAISKKTKTNFSSNATSAIKPIKITYNSKDQSISIETIEDPENRITENGTTKIVKSGTGSAVIISTEDHKSTNPNMEVIIEDSQGNDKDRQVLIKRKTTVIDLNSDASENKEKISFITKDKDGKVVTEEILKTDEKQTWVVEEGGANEIQLIKAKTKDNTLFISTDSENSPLIFIDNVESTKEDLEALDPNNIESIHVVKGDKHTKIYGDKAKEGVIQVTTKK